MSSDPMDAAARAAVAQVTGLGIESLYLGGLPKPSLKVDAPPDGMVARLIAERDAARADTACLRAALDAMTQERDAAVAALAEMRDRLPAGERDRTPTPTPGPRDLAGCLFSRVRDTTGWGSLG